MDEPAVRATIAQQVLGPNETLPVVVKVMEHLVKRARRTTKLRLVGIACTQPHHRLFLLSDCSA